MEEKESPPVNQGVIVNQGVKVKYVVDGVDDSVKGLMCDIFTELTFGEMTSQVAAINKRAS